MTSSTPDRRARRPSDDDTTAIRPIGPDDLARVLQINQQNVPEVGSVDADELAFLVDESALPLATWCSDELAGFCLVFAPGSPYESENYRWFAEHSPSAWYLDRVAFDARFQGRGLGRRLYAEVDRAMRDAEPPPPALTLEVNADPPNEASLAFHARLGFAEVGRRTSHGFVVSLMQRDL